MSGRRRHIYGFIKTGNGAPFAPIPVDGSSLKAEAVAYRDLAAVVSESWEIPLPQADREGLLRGLLRHQRVLEGIMSQRPVLPAKYGTAAENAEEVALILEAGYSRLKRALEASRGLAEFEILVLWDLQSALTRIGRTEEIQRLRQELGARLSQADQEAKIQLGKRIKARLDDEKDKLQRELEQCLREMLSRHLHEARRHETKDDSMVMNLALLIDRSAENALGAALAALDGRHDGRLLCRCIGPLPPHSFSTVEVSCYGAGAVEEARKALGLGIEASLAEIREAHRTLAAQCHPDRHQGDPRARRRFEEVIAACQLLSSYCRDYRCSFAPKAVAQTVGIAITRPGDDGALPRRG